nr:flagellar hook-basal body complex protein FliE [Oceanobacter mangrovi]
MRQVKSQLLAQQEQLVGSQNNQVNRVANPAVNSVTPGSQIGGINPSRFQAQLAQQLEAVNAAPATERPRMDETVPDFQTMFANGINSVNRTQQAATNLATRFEQGDPQVDLPEVMIAMQKSSVSFQAMTQVRNKLVEAYKDVMNMPL